MSLRAKRSNPAKTFAEVVYKLLAKVPAGQLTTYSALARLAGKPGAARAVGNILHRNPHPIQVPCHRVVRADGSVGGYADGARKKIALLRREGVKINDGRINL